ncbi:hypothetical protein V5O48_015160 [Marasmius crinis-equi]|uniref:F-box domain-containing protein n=1 Tax=Marasmius crinis-equi TaxID=585013 RepID=A0ABR3EV95_9AGAR
MDTSCIKIPEPLCLPGPDLQPDIETQLRSLQPIVVHEVPKISQFLREAKADLDIYDRIICDLEDKITKVRAKRDSLQTYVARYSSLLSPVRRLPSEIIQEIFAFASVGIGRAGNMLGVYSQWESRAMRISAICHRWRTIALDTPELWSCFAVQLQERARDPVELFLTRSKQVPLSLTIANSGANVPLDEGVASALVAHSARWRSVDYHNLWYCPSVLDIIDQAPTLPSLRDVVCLVPDDGAPIVHSGQLKDSTRLDTVAIRYDFYNSVPIDSLPLDTAKTVIFQWGKDGAFTHSLEVLRACADVVKSLTYESSPDTADWTAILHADHTPAPNEDDPIECKNVHSLTVYLFHDHGTYAHLSDIFQSLTLPSLTSVYLYGDSNTTEDNPDGAFDGEWPGSVVDLFFARSRCYLTKLTLEGLPLDGSQLLSFLQHTPLLESLVVIEFSAVDYWVQPQTSPNLLTKTVTKSLVQKLRIQIESAPTPFLPKLDIFRFRVQQHFDADVEFVDMLKSRWYSPIPASGTNPPFQHRSLRTASLHILDRDVDEYIYQPLKALDAEGMMVVVNAGGKIVI